MSTYNLKDVEEMADGDQDFLLVVVQTFLEEVPPDAAAMNEAIANGNATLAYRYAHKMKPNLKLFGLDLMPQITTIEHWSKQGKNNEDVPEAGSIITTKVDQVCKELKEDFNL
ncbi:MULTISPECIES: Hpt domain-containing protein [unclassified Zunongwangia]|uniref:Hpt domain-containing protein n=1 Tax=unclassified Zunongwangia TaxID=2632541 RepID=UPI0022DD0CFF|nr:MULTISPECIES: Hpt domain-containing protein [unclassified Zunongwangia]WBL21375.1 Hpt domain-containing protein [Zunongwangia sp. HRR-M8]WBL26674.1 Hpt domain-containing protein [Zunongwangia sp. HGR-M22]